MVKVALNTVCIVCGLMHMTLDGACDMPEPKVEKLKVEKKPKAKKSAKKAKK
tara:strand:- start:37 stop:192 length:156 start_codon:yes stop_codon:yes gene_type:complete